MHFSAAMKGLLDKEWRHNRGYMLVTFILIIYAPVIKTLLVIMQGDNSLSQWGQELNYALHFGIGLIHPMHYTGVLEWLPFTGSVLLGIIMLGTEQQSGLKYLVSTPVSRRQIILSKFIPGAATILIAMLINALFLIGLKTIHPMPFEIRDVLNWTMLAGVVCLAYYTLGLMAAAFSVGVLSAGIFVFLLNILPGLLTNMIGNIAARYFAASQALLLRIHTVGSYFNLSDYISRNGRNIDHIHYSNLITVTGVSSDSIKSPDYLMESGMLLIAVLLFLLLAVIIFERISLSAGGSMFMSSGARKAGLVIGATYLAYILVFPRAESLLMFSIYLVVVTGLICIGVIFLYRLQPGGWRIFHKKQKSMG